jgi:hypothetical protein
MIALRCIRCFWCNHPAFDFMGHVHKNDNVITVGWCRMCVYQGFNKKIRFSSCPLYPTGCLGTWSFKYGVQKIIKL